MEHNQFDELARKTVQEKESGSTLDSKQADLLWAQIGSNESKSYVGWWRAAAIILFLLSFSSAWYAVKIGKSQEVMKAQLQAAEENKLAALSLLEQKDSMNTNNESLETLSVKTETVFLRDTIVKTIVEEKIVFVDREVLVPSTFDGDSLIAIIQAQQAELNQLTTYAQAGNSKEYLNNFNVVFDDSEGSNEPTPSIQKQASFKFNLSLLKRN